MMARRAQGGEAGFAMLVVFLLAAFIGIALYMEMPRVVMESQRDREELLIDRGTQYKRAIQVFYRKFSRYPTDLDALDNTNNIRFLRRRYKDPMTGEDEWRLIHAAGPGIFTDSLVNAPPGAQPAQSADTSTGSEEETPTPIWMQQRPSDRILAGGDSTAPPMPGMEETPPEQVASNSGAPAPGTVVTVDGSGTDSRGVSGRDASRTGADGVGSGIAGGHGLTLPSPVPTGPPPPGTIVRAAIRKPTADTDRSGHDGAVAPGQAGAAYPDDGDRRGRLADYPAGQPGDPDDPATPHLAEPEGDGDGASVRRRAAAVTGRRDRRGGEQARVRVDQGLQRPLEVQRVGVHL